jgi:hypothetical protein
MNFGNNRQFKIQTAVTFLSENSSITQYHGIFKTRDGKFGVRNSNGKITIPPKYDAIIDNKSSGYWVKKEEKYQLFVENGYSTSDTLFEEVNLFFEGRAVVKSDGKWGVIDDVGQWIIEPSYDFSDIKVHEGILPYQIGEKWGYVQMDKKILSLPIFEGASGFDSGIAVVQKDNKCALIKNDMTLITDFIFEYAFRPSEGIIAICQNEKWGYANETGKIVIPCIYDFALRFKMGKGCVLKDGKWFTIYRDGQLAIQMDE